MKVTKNRGYTLIELMVVVAIMAFLIVGIVAVFLALLKSQVKTNALARIKREGDRSTVALEQMIREGYKLVCPTDEEILEIYSREGEEIYQKTVDLSVGQLVVSSCQYDLDLITCITGTSTTEVLTGTGVTATGLATDCKETNDFDVQAAKVEYILGDVDSPDTVVPFRVITTTRNLGTAGQ